MNGLKTVATVGKKIFKPVTKAVAKVTTKLNVNKPEIMVIGGVVMVVVGTGIAIAKTLKVQEVMAESSDKMAIAVAQREGTVVNYNGEQVPAVTEAEFRKMVTKVRSETVWAFIKMYGIPALLFILGIFTLVKGHWILKERYILAATSLKGMEQFMNFVKKNVIADAGEEKWKEYATGKVDEKEITCKIKDADGTEKEQKYKVPICRSYDNPWRFEFCEELFDSWQPNAETNITFLQGVENYFDQWRYQKDKRAEISMFEVLDYLRFRWDKVDKHYRKWLRVNGWGHDINGDDHISLGIHKPINDPARRRLGDQVFIEMNIDGQLDQLQNKYYDME